MKKCLFSFIMTLSFLLSFSQDSTKVKLLYDPKKPTYEVEATCGTCMYKMKGDGCHLAIKLNGKNYFVDGTGIDDHGKATGKEILNLSKKIQEDVFQKFSIFLEREVNIF